MSDMERLRAVAEAAMDRRGLCCYLVGTPDCSCPAGPISVNANAVLALLDEVERLRAVVQRVEALLAPQRIRDAISGAEAKIPVHFVKGRDLRAALAPAESHAGHVLEREFDAEDLKARMKAVLAACDLAENEARHVVDDEVYVSVGLIRNALNGIACEEGSR